MTGTSHTPGTKKQHVHLDARYCAAKIGRSFACFRSAGYFDLRRCVPLTKNSGRIYPSMLSSNRWKFRSESICTCGDSPRGFPSTRHEKPLIFFESFQGALALFWHPPCLPSFLPLALVCSSCPAGTLLKHPLRSSETPS